MCLNHGRPPVSPSAGAGDSVLRGYLGNTVMQRFKLTGKAALITGKYLSLRRLGCQGWLLCLGMEACRASLKGGVRAQRRSVQHASRMPGGDDYSLSRACQHATHTIHHTLRHRCWPRHRQSLGTRTGRGRSCSSRWFGLRLLAAFISVHHSFNACAC